jgi:hypothetical protein
MTETVKKTTTKTKTPAKSRKSATTTTAGTNGTPNTRTTGTNGVSNNVTEMRLSHEQVAQLAHRFWNERGRQDGHHEEDWFRAEQALRGKAS